MGKLAFRLHTEEDIPRLIAFWNEHGGWATTSEEKVHRLLESSRNPIQIAVAEHRKTGEFVSLLGLRTSRVRVHGRTLNALRPFGAIVSKTARGSSFSLNPADHPVIGLYRYGVDALGARGYSLSYSLPDPKWVPFFRLFPNMQIGLFPKWRHRLPLPELLPLPEGYTAGPIDVLDPRVDLLWEATARRYDCMAERNGAALHDKMLLRDYDALGVERDGELIGLALSTSHGRMVFSICDLLSLDDGESLRATLTAAANRMHERRLTSLRTARQVSILATPPMEPVLHDLGFQPGTYKFALTVRPLDPELSRQEIAPDRWYISAND